MKRELAEVERDARIRSAFVDATSIDYRARCNKGLGPQQLHAELNQLTFNNGKKLTARNIASIVNYCYYRGDPTAIERIMERAVFR
tara:strand:- start:874 stop:1131 length:258 start_codon:yes stop_codon:yes gene_type:complete